MASATFFAQSVTIGWCVGGIGLFPGISKGSYVDFSGAVFEGLLASALIVDTPLQNLLKNFSLLFYKQSVPFRLFNKENDALLWLFKFIKEEASYEF